MTKAKDPELFAPEKPAKQAKSAKQANLPVAREATPPAPRSLYEAILRASADPAVDVDKLKVLVDVQIQVEEREAMKAFTRAFNSLQFELPTIDKDGKIDHGEGTTAKGNKKLKSSYSTYPNLMGVCRPLLRKHGFTFNNIIEPAADASRIVIVGYLTHVDGHAMVSRFPLSLDAGPGRSNAQAWGSSSSYGKRYNLILLLDIVSEAPMDQDDDAGKPKDKRIDDGKVPDQSALSPAQIEELRVAIANCGVGEDKFLLHYQIDQVEDLDPKLFKEAIDACAKHMARRAANAKGAPDA